jgi:protein-arginine kinase activator protein McsA
MPEGLGRGDSLEIELLDLKARLQRAVQLEEYEEAAYLRDDIRKLENK